MCYILCVWMAHCVRCYCHSRRCAFNQQLDLVWGCSQTEMFEAIRCGHTWLSARKREWMHCGLPPLVAWPASGGPRWRRPVGPTSADCWRETRGGGEAFCLLSAPLIAHLIRAPHPLHLLPPPLPAEPPFLVPSHHSYHRLHSWNSNHAQYSLAEEIPRLRVMRFLASKSRRHALVGHCGKRRFVINVSKFSLGVWNIPESVDSLSTFTKGPDEWNL